MTAIFFYFFDDFMRNINVGKTYRSFTSNIDVFL